MARGFDRPIRVGFDDQIFEAQRRGGVSKYFVELIEQLPRHGIQPIVLSTQTRNVHLQESGLIPATPRRSPAAERAAWASWRVVGHPRSPPHPRPQLDVMHHTFTHPAYLHGWRGPRVVTVYDMTPELFPEYFKLGNPHLAKRRYVEASDAVIAISRNTAGDMVRLYDLEGLQEKTTVVHLGVDGRFFVGRDDTALSLPQHYLLFVGVRSGYKDFSTALAAWSRLAVHDQRLEFVVVGGGPFSRSEQRRIAESGDAASVHHLVPDDDQIVEVYRRAAALVFPSRYEGFGLPTLESLATGTPVVLADASCSREVGGAAALYFAQGDVDELVDRLARAMSPEFRASIRLEGPAHSEEFSWDRTAALTADIYRRVVGRPTS